MQFVRFRTGPNLILCLLIGMTLHATACSNSSQKPENSSQTASDSATSSFVVFENNAPAAWINLAADASADMKAAVSVFRSTLQEGYAIDLPVEPSNGLDNQIQLVIEDRDLLDADRTEIDFPNVNTLRITGGESGVRRALFFLLEEHAGVRFLYEGVMGDKDNRTRIHYPPMQTLSIPCKAVSRNSSYPLRRAISNSGTYYGQSNSDAFVRKYFWSWQMQIGAKAGYDSVHALGAAKRRSRPGEENKGIIFPIDRYASGELKVADEVFPIKDGKRFLPYKAKKSTWTNGWEPCFTHPATLEEAVKNITAFLDVHPGKHILSLAVNDNGGHCECDACMAVDGTSSNALGFTNRSESYYRWVNQVVARVNAKYPKVMFSLIAYREVLAVPSFKLDPNVIVDITMDFQPTIAPEILDERQSMIRQWEEHAQHLGFYLYNSGSWSWSLPRLYMAQQQAMLRFARDHGAVSSVAESNHFFSLTEGPNVYAYFKLLENPDLDLDALVTDWCKAAVGDDAGPALKNYFMFWEKFWRTQAVKVDQFWDRRDATYLQRGYFATYMYGLEPGDIAHCRTLMQQVVVKAKANGDPWQQQRASLLMTTFEWFEAAAIATAAEFISPAGHVADASTAAALLRTIPAAAKAHERWREILTDTKMWVGVEQMLPRDRPGVAAFAMSTVQPFIHDEAVQKELAAINKNTQCPINIRELAATMLQIAAQKPASTRILNLSFDDNQTNGWVPLFDVHGSIDCRQPPSSSADAANNPALACHVGHVNFSAVMPLNNLSNYADYLVTARIYIAADAPNEDSTGTIEFAGNPLPLGWNQPVHRFKTGRWYEVHAYIPHRKLLNEKESARLASEVGGLAQGSDVKDLVKGRLLLRARNFPKGTTVYLDDVELYELSTLDKKP